LNIMSFLPAGQALHTLRVLDLTRARAGPTCARQFADFGADVIKIEATADANDGLTGERDGPDFQNLHRNKRGMTLNLKKPEGHALFMKMVKGADIVVENYRPDVKTRLGIDYEALAKVNPRIILASISGFGQTGPYSKRAGLDPVAQGMGGLMWVTGNPGDGPMRAGAAVADMTSGFLATIGILMALYERERSGRGQWVQTNLLQAQIALLDFQAARYAMEGDVPGQAGNDHPTVMPASAYKTKDGYLTIAAPGRLWPRLCESLGDASLATRPEFATGPLRSKNRLALKDALEKLLAVKTSAQWNEILNDAGVPCGPIYKMDEVFADPQVRHLKVSAPVKHGRLGDINIISQAITLSRTPADIVRATPELGEHTDEILAEMGCSPEEIRALHEQGAV
jgi:crotonobetainyl-CoA:carnitine CoA-transferase CaiB-like acyl-CoA transferase